LSLRDEWAKDFQLTTIGSNYCHSRMFAVDQETFEMFKMYNTLRENVVLAHQQLYSHVNSKMEKLKLGLKSVRLAGVSLPTDEQILAVGLEGGVVKFRPKELWTTVWVCVIAHDEDERLFEANGARFQLPEIIARPILAGGEMGPIFKELFHDDIKRKQGGIGIVTENFVTRTEEYAAVVKMALGLWYGRNWQRILPKVKNNNVV